MFVGHCLHVMSSAKEWKKNLLIDWFDGASSSLFFYHHTLFKSSGRQVLVIVLRQRYKKCVCCVFFASFTKPPTNIVIAWNVCKVYDCRAFYQNVGIWRNVKGLRNSTGKWVTKHWVLGPLIIDVNNVGAMAINELCSYGNCLIFRWLDKRFIVGSKCFCWLNTIWCKPKSIYFAV